MISRFISTSCVPFVLSPRFSRFFLMFFFGMCSTWSFMVSNALSSSMAILSNSFISAKRCSSSASSASMRARSSCSCCSCTSCASFSSSSMDDSLLSSSAACFSASIISISCSFISSWSPLASTFLCLSSFSTADFFIFLNAFTKVLYASSAASCSPAISAILASSALIRFCCSSLPSISCSSASASRSSSAVFLPFVLRPRFSSCFRSPGALSLVSFLLSFPRWASAASRSASSSASCSCSAANASLCAS
eukprot:SAG25_NODE_785_length_5338_cov_5.205001_2_plen_251_part_00